MKFEDSLAFKFPNLIKEWDYDKNKSITPECVYSGSHIVVYWICPICNQSYPKKICNRTAPSKRKTESNRCPVCLGRYIIPEFNSLKAKYPKIVEEEWDYSKNKISPDKIPPHKNNPKFWWLCPKGHSYETTVNNKTSGTGGNCPFCSHQKLSIEYSLSNLNPELSKEWNYDENYPLTPNSIFASSNKTVHWICAKCGYKWSAKICNRHNGRGCPKCALGRHSSFPEQVIYHYIKILFPNTINGYKLKNTEIDIFIPSLNIGIEYDGEYYHKSQYRLKKDIEKNQLIFENGISLIRIRESNCIPMSNDKCTIYQYQYSSDYQKLNMLLERLLSDLCNKAGISYNIVIDIDSIRKKIIAELHVLPYKKSFAAYIEKHCNIKAKWDFVANYPITPEMVQPNSDKRMSWICINNPNHRWDAPVKSISKGYGCDWCAKRHKYSTEEWVEQAKLVHADKYDYSKAKYKNSNTKVLIGCPIHGDFNQRASEHLKGKGCKWCGGQGGFHELNTLAFAYPELAKEWDSNHPGNKSLTPKDVLITDNTNLYWWKCNNGKSHSYYAKISYRIKRKSGCAVCHGKQISYDTSLEFLRPDLVAEWHDGNTIRPNEVSLGSEKVVQWKCSNPEHSIYNASVYNRTHLNSGCPECTKNGNPSLTGKE